MDTFTRLMESLPTLAQTMSPSERAALSSLVELKVIKPVPEELAFIFWSAEQMLDADELEVYNRLQAEEMPTTGSVRSQTFMIMKATRLCNLRCTYCHSWRDDPNQKMLFSILAKATRDVLKSKTAKQIEFVWHGGEVTLLPLSFFKKALWLQYAFKSRDQTVTNSLQTNATRLTSEWIHFFKYSEFQVGVSLDGPPELHDARRIKTNGEGTWKDVVAGIRQLRDGEIPFGVLVVVDRQVVKYGATRLLDYLVGLDIKGAALLNVIPDNASEKPDDDDYLPWPEFVAFLKDLLLVWWSGYRDKIVIRELAGLVNNVAGGNPTICEFAGNCMGQFLTVDPNGDVSACDKYIGDESLMFGNLSEKTLPELLSHSLNLSLAKKDAKDGIRLMKDCKYYRHCNGGCPHDVRLNQRNVPEWDSGCCGMSSLMEEIETLLLSGCR